MKTDFPSLLTVALALSYVFFVVSLFVSGVGEFINTVVLDRRARLLHRSIESMFGDPAFATALYTHPLVKGQNARRKKVLLEHLPFVHRSGQSTDTEVEQLPSYIAPPNFSAFVLSLLRDALPGSPPTPLTLSEIGSAATAVGAMYPDLQKVLTALLQGVTDEAGFKTSLETWYSEYMERVSGFFKRETQETLRYVALVLAVLLNIDTIQLTHRMFTEPAVAGMLANQGESLVESVDSRDSVQTAILRMRQRQLQKNRNDDSLKLLKNFLKPISADDTLLNQAKLDSHRVHYQKKLAALHDSTQAATYRDQVETLRDLANETVELPLGWSQREADLLVGWNLLLKPVGWLLTMVAASFGAPFWFDLLVLLVNIRNVGRKPEEKQVGDRKK